MGKRIALSWIVYFGGFLLWWYAKHYYNLALLWSFKFMFSLLHLTPLYSRIWLDSLYKSLLCMCCYKRIELRCGNVFIHRDKFNKLDIHPTDIIFNTCSINIDNKTISVFVKRNIEHFRPLQAQRVVSARVDRRFFARIKHCTKFQG